MITRTLSRCTFLMIPCWRVGVRAGMSID
jgi:hypothetical protein